MTRKVPGETPSKTLSRCCIPREIGISEFKDIGERLTGPEGVSQRKLPELALCAEDVVATGVFVTELLGVGIARVLKISGLSLGVVDLVLGPLRAVTVDLLHLGAGIEGRLGDRGGQEAEEDDLLKAEHHVEVC